MNNVTIVDAPDVGEIFERTVTSVSDLVVTLKHENAVDLELRFHTLAVSKSGILFHRSSTETGIELSLATRVMPQTRAVFATTPQTVDFGEIRSGASMTKRLVIMNKGSRDLQVTALNFSNPANCTFELMTQLALPVPVKAGAQLPIDIECTVNRKDADTNTGALVVSYDDVVSHGTQRTPVHIPLIANQD